MFNLSEDKKIEYFNTHISDKLLVILIYFEVIVQETTG